MKQSHTQPSRNWVGVSLSLLLVIGSSLLIAWQVVELITEATADPPAAPAPGAAPINEGTTRGHAWARVEREGEPS
jgi:hypothetical protein